jgi:transposase-like protein
VESIGVEFFQARSKTLVTRVGKLELLLPQDRNGQFSPSKSYERSENTVGTR